MKFSKMIDQVIAQNIEKLQKPGVLSVRPGYQAVDGWPTRKPAIVVNVIHKRDDLPPEDRLPETLGGYPVDVREPGELEKIRLSEPAKYAALAGAIPPELRPTVFPYERDFTGTPLAPMSEAIEAAHAAPKDKLDYSHPAAPLDPVEERMTITCHASPDAGWPTLQPFLEGTADTLTIGMYDFTSTHIADTFKTLGGRRNKPQLNLVLDHPPTKKTREQTDDDTQDELQQAFGGNFRFAWALERRDPKVAVWIYPSAYHIKVVVRDSSAFWLSSGNFNSSNQPDINPIKNPTLPAATFKTCDRDWHVIVEDKKLAKLFEAYLLNDLKVAEANQGRPDLESMAAALDLQSVPDLMVAAREPTQFFKPKTITAQMKIQPILTPDNYAPLILDLIKSAQKSFYMQTQYVSISPNSPPDNADFMALIQAVADKINEGIDVRLIFSQYETTEKLELLQDAGVDLDHVRIQANVHNKGMIVDSQVVAVGSQNWSGDGTLRNRDATLIIYNEQAAQYWEQIFIHDWTTMILSRPRE